MISRKRILITIISALIALGIFIGTCYCAYHIPSWNERAFWWSWFVILWVLDVSVGVYIFYKNNRTDEMKAFWLFIMVVLPVCGAIATLVFNIKLKTEYSTSNTDHTKLQVEIFKAKSSIKIYTNSLFVTTDTFKALNFARWKNIDIQIVLSAPKKKSKQEFMIENLQKYLEDKIQLYLTNIPIESSFIIFDDKTVLTTPKNFNFKHVYSEKIMSISNDVSPYMTKWENGLERSSFYSLKKEKLPAWKRVKNKVINIFYPFF